MKDDKKTFHDEVALFRYSVLGELVHLPRGSKGIYERIVAKSELDYEIPGSLRRHVAPETIRYWLRLYRKGGFDALRPKPRKDAGRSRALPQQVADVLVSIKEQNRELTVNQVIREARKDPLVVAEQPLPRSTVHRLLSRHGLMRKPRQPSKDLRRFAYEHAGELWMSDVMHGPSVVVDGRRKRKTYLIAFIDDATRVVPYAAFALAENTQAFLPVLRDAVLRRGIPRRLFVDNGSAFRSHQLALVCAKLGITLIHARAYHAAAKGKIERWFRTVRMQLLPVLASDDLSSVERLNRRLWSWVEGEYHHAAHRGLDGQTPLDRWAQRASEVRFVEPGVDLHDLCLWETKRKVKKDRTVSLHGVVYEVDAHLVDETVVLRYDPSRSGKPVQVWHRGKRVQTADQVDVHANCFVKREQPLRLSDLSDDDEGGR